MLWSDLWPTLALAPLAAGAKTMIRRNLHLNFLVHKLHTCYPHLPSTTSTTKEIGPFPSFSNTWCDWTVSVKCVFPCVSSIQWHTALLPPLRLQRRVECQSHGKPAIGIRCLPWQIWKRHKATLDPGPGSHIQQTLNGDVWKPQSGISSDVAPVRYCAGSLR